MGYYSTFRISPSLEEIKQKISDLENLKAFKYWLLVEEEIGDNFGDERKWYTWKNDFCEISKKIPVAFQITREGEGAGDCEVAVFDKGEVQLSWELDYSPPNLLEIYMESKS